MTTIGKPSGTAATAKLIDVITKSRNGIPRHHPRAKRMATMPSAAQTRNFPKTSNLRCRGVAGSCAMVLIKPAMRPNSVCMAMATTTARPLPFATLVPMKTRLLRSASATTATGKVALCLARTRDSPVSTASLHVSDEHVSRRASAATRSPAASIKTSPTTTCVAGITVTLPSRHTLAFGAVIRFKDEIEASALYS